MRKIITTSLFILVAFYGHTQTKKFKSSTYNYTINTPGGFERKSATGKHIDYKVTNQDGSSILVNVSKRLPEEKGMDGHSYTKEYFKTVFNQTDPNTIISNTEKIIVDGKKTFLIYYSYPSNRGNYLKVIEAYLFVGDNVYVITTTAGDDKYETYKDIFLQTIKSIKFQ